MNTTVTKDDRQESTSAPPLIGIAIPAYKSAETLEATLRSCQAQTWSNWIAYVTVDGEEARRETQIVEALGDPRIRIECNGRQLGQMANFNRAMLRCHAAGAAWIKTMCADDILYPDALERLLKIGISSPTCGLTYGHFDIIDETGAVTFYNDLRQMPSRIVKGSDFLKMVLPAFRNPSGGPSNAMIRAEVLEGCGLLDDALFYSGDRDYWYRIAGRYDIGYVGEKTILSYRRHSNSVSGRLSSSSARMAEDGDLGRRIAARYAPWSREWWLAQLFTGRAVATNAITCTAMMRSAGIRACLSGLAVSARRLSPITLPLALFNVIFMLGRYVACGSVVAATEIDPAMLPSPDGRRPSWASGLSPNENGEDA